jgi:hypothetical protein
MAFDAPINAARDLIQRLPHQQRRRVAGQFNHFDTAPDVAFGLFVRFAVFARHQSREFFKMLFQQMCETKHHARTSDNGCVRPIGKRLSGCLHGAVNVLGIAVRRLRDQFAARRIEHRCELRRVGCQQFAADDVSDFVVLRAAS